jgi:copper chaperone
MLTTMSTFRFVVPAMTCRHCVRTVTAALRDIRGVERIQADARTATVEVTGTLAEADVRTALDECGYPSA